MPSTRDGWIAADVNFPKMKGERNTLRLHSPGPYSVSGRLAHLAHLALGATNSNHDRKVAGRFEILELSIRVSRSMPKDVNQRLKIQVN